MSASTYHEVLRRIRRLISTDQLRLIEELASNLRRQDTT